MIEKIERNANGDDLLRLVGLSRLMARTSGIPEIAIGLIDGPVVAAHPDLASERIHEVSGEVPAKCARTESVACVHGTFVAGILSGRRGKLAPAICPECTLLVRPIFTEVPPNMPMPSATPEALAAAIIDCVDARARVLNLSLGIVHSSPGGERELVESLDYALSRGAIVVAAAGNQATIGSSVITRHPWVIPVAASDALGRPVGQSNYGASVARRGLSAPGEAVTSLAPSGPSVTMGGTSVAAPFVTGAIALLWAEFPTETAGRLKVALLNSKAANRRGVVPPILDADASYRALIRMR